MGIESRLKEFFADFGADLTEERVVEYVVDEIKKGRRLADILEDPYVKNRLSTERRESLPVEHAALIEAIDEEIRGTFGRLEGGTSA